MQFYKYHGLGNDYLVYDINKNSETLTTEKIVKICNRNFGFGSDGILAGPYNLDGKISVKIFNPDGSEAEKSGNGTIIFAKYLKDAGYITTDQFMLNTLGGDVFVKYNNDTGTDITISMGKLDFSRQAVGAIHVPEELVNVPLTFHETNYRCTCVSIGNPHCVILMDEISKEKVCEIGNYSETAPYFPNRINTQIVKILDRHNIQIEIFERGAGYTLASGSSSCAAAGATIRLGHTESPVHVHMPGGVLHIDVDDSYQVHMTGTVEYIGRMEI